MQCEPPIPLPSQPQVRPPPGPHRGMGTSTSCPSARGLSFRGDSATALTTLGTACINSTGGQAREMTGMSLQTCPPDALGQPYNSRDASCCPCASKAAQPATSPQAHILVKHGDGQQLRVAHRHAAARLERQAVAVHVHLRRERGCSTGASCPGQPAGAHSNLTKQNNRTFLPPHVYFAAGPQAQPTPFRRQPAPAAP